MSTIYLAGRLGDGEETIADFASELEHEGHQILEPWWTKGALPKPYLENHRTSTPAARAMLTAAYECQAFVLFPTDDILGAAVEFGAALGSTIAHPEKHVIVVDPFEVRQSIFYAHPAVSIVRTAGAARRLLRS